MWLIRCRSYSEAKLMMLLQEFLVNELMLLTNKLNAGVYTLFLQASWCQHLHYPTCMLSRYYSKICI